MQSTQDNGGGPSVLTAAQAADFLHVRPNHVYRLLVAGELPGRKVGGVWRISKGQLVAWLEGTP